MKARPYNEVKHQTLLAKLELVNKLWYSAVEGIPFFFMAQRSGRPLAKKHADALRKHTRSCIEIAGALGIEMGVFKDALNEFTGAARAEQLAWNSRLGKPTEAKKRPALKPRRKLSDVEKLIFAERRKILAALGRIQPSVSKAVAVLRDDLSDPDFFSFAAAALLSRGEQVPETLRARLEDWLNDGIPNTVSSDEYLEYYSSILRCFDVLLSKEVDKKAFDWSENIRAELEGGGLWLPVATEGRDAHDLRRALLLLWFSSKSRYLRFGLMPNARRALPAIRSWQQNTGCWHELKFPIVDRAHLNYVPSSLNTALAIHALLSYGDSGSDATAVRKGTDWLLAHAEKSGGWADHATKRDGFDVFTTLVVLDCLRRADVSATHARILSAEAVLMADQSETGAWAQKGYSFRFLTALAVEYFDKRALRGIGEGQYVLSARSLFAKCSELLVADTTADATLALVAAYHGLEHLLYAFLELTEQNFDLTPHGRSVGFRDALAQFEITARREGWIESSKGLPRKTQLSLVATHRDNFIHLAKSIDMVTAKQGVNHVLAFVRQFDTKVLKYSVLE